MDEKVRFAVNLDLPDEVIEGYREYAREHDRSVRKQLSFDVAQIVKKFQKNKEN